MPASALRSRLSGAWLLVSVLVTTAAEGHVVPNMTLEADFPGGDAYTLRINVDPRTFLAADPTSLPPVPASWYREQTPEQLTATHKKAGEYLSRALGLLFNGKKNTLPTCEVQAIDGADNTPLKPETQEIHLLAVAKGKLPPGATEFRLDFAKDANTTLILMASQAGQVAPRPQVIFPGETSRPFHLEPRKQATPEPRHNAAAVSMSPWERVLLGSTLGVVGILLLVGWRMLVRYRHRHRMHRRPEMEA